MQRPAFSSNGVSPAEPPFVTLDDDGRFAQATPAWTLPWFSPSSLAPSSSSSTTTTSMPESTLEIDDDNDSANGNNVEKSAHDASIASHVVQSLKGWEARTASPDPVSSFRLLESVSRSEDDLVAGPVKQRQDSFTSSSPQDQLSITPESLTSPSPVNDEASALRLRDFPHLSSHRRESHLEPSFSFNSSAREETRDPPKTTQRTSTSPRDDEATHFPLNQHSDDLQKGLPNRDTVPGAQDDSAASVARGLDALVEASVERQRQKEREGASQVVWTSEKRTTTTTTQTQANSTRTAQLTTVKRPGIAFLKTHKCGSSTLGSIFFRYAARHRQRMPFIHHNIASGHELKTNVTTCDVALQHIQATKWRFALEWYTRAVANPVFITVLREPVSHYVSWAHFYKLPETSVCTEETGGNCANLTGDPTESRVKRPMTLDEFVASKGARKNPMAHSVGLYRSEHLKGFVDTFALIVIMEEFDHGLILLKRLLDWDFVDLTYFKINDSHQAALSKKATKTSSLLKRSWDGLPVTPSPKVSALSEATLQRVQQLTAHLDRPLYDMASSKFRSQMEAAGLASVKEELASFRVLQDSLSLFCSQAGLARSPLPEQALTRADFGDVGEWTLHLRHGWKQPPHVRKAPRPLARLSPLHVASVPLMTPPPNLTVPTTGPQGTSSRNSSSWNDVESDDDAPELRTCFWACRWYSLSDLQYEKQIQPSGLASAVSFSSTEPPE